MSPKAKSSSLLFVLVIASVALGIMSWLALTLLGVKTNQNSSDIEQNSPSQLPSSEVSRSTTFESITEVPSGLFNYGGSTTWVPLRQEIDPIIQRSFPQFQLRYVQPIAGNPGSGSGIKMLLNNQLAFSQSSRPLKLKEYQQAKEMGFSLEAIPVAIDAIVLGINPQLNVSGITIEQLQKIYTGEIKNWQQVGGPDLPIIPYTKPTQLSGTSEFFAENILLEQKFAANVQYIGNTTEALRKVSKNLGAIYYASAAEVIPQCQIKPLPLGSKKGEWVTPYQPPYIPSSDCPQQRNKLNTKAFLSGDYPITRRLFVIVKHGNSVDEQAGMAYAKLLLTDQGQDLVVKAGFISLR